MDIHELSSIISKMAAKSRPAVCINSKDCGDGDIFVAVKGTKVDGYDFISAAIKNGVRFVVTEKPFNSDKAEIIIVDDAAVAVGLLSQLRFDNPSNKLTNLAVTGTNGKTTVTFSVKSVIESAGKKCGLIGTIVNDAGNHNQKQANMTTPDGVAVAAMANEMVAAGTEFMVVEASSHAIEQKRLAGVNFKAAAFTNLTGDHLDYHGTMKNYLQAKTKLFSGLDNNSVAILNIEDKASKKIAAKTNAKKLFYGIETDCDIIGTIESMDVNGTKFKISYDGDSCEIVSHMPGRHNVSNNLAAAGLCIAAGFSLEQIANGLSGLKAVPGRLETVKHDGDFAVLVDYAHTDDALKNVLKTLKPLCKNRLCVVFGCGGDRDVTKRARMATVAEQLAHRIVVTSDNPRTEKPDTIIDDILKGFSAEAMDRVIVEADREKAIAIAIKNAKAGDIVLLAGKGHEDYQVLGIEKIHFSDFEIAKKYL